MNRMTRKDWNQNASKDTVTSAGVIAAGLLIVISAAFTAFTGSAPQDNKTAYQQEADGRIIVTAKRLKAGDGQASANLNKTGKSVVVATSSTVPEKSAINISIAD